MGIASDSRRTGWVRNQDHRPASVCTDSVERARSTLFLGARSSELALAIVDLSRISLGYRAPYVENEEVERTGEYPEWPKFVHKLVGR